MREGSYWFTYEDGHILLPLLGDHYVLLDTGSPQSFMTPDAAANQYGPLPVPLAGRVLPDLPDNVRRAVNQNVRDGIVGLLGTDLLQEWDISTRYPECEVHFSEALLPAQSGCTRLGIDVTSGIPKLSGVVFGGNGIAAAFDTGAKLGYAHPRLLYGLDPISRDSDFYPGHRGGRPFDVEVYALPVTLGELHTTLTATRGLSMLDQLGVSLLIGSDLITKCNIRLSVRGGFIDLEPVTAGLRQTGRTAALIMTQPMLADSPTPFHREMAPDEFWYQLIGGRSSAATGFCVEWFRDEPARCVSYLGALIVEMVQELHASDGNFHVRHGSQTLLRSRGDSFEYHEVHHFCEGLCNDSQLTGALLQWLSVRGVPAWFNPLAQAYLQHIAGNPARLEALKTGARGQGVSHCPKYFPALLRSERDAARLALSWFEGDPESTVTCIGNLLAQAFFEGPILRFWWRRPYDMVTENLTFVKWPAYSLTTERMPSQTYFGYDRLPIDHESLLRFCELLYEQPNFVRALTVHIRSLGVPESKDLLTNRTRNMISLKRGHTWDDPDFRDPEPLPASVKEAYAEEVRLRWAAIRESEARMAADHERTEAARKQAVAEKRLSKRQVLAEKQLVKQQERRKEGDKRLAIRQELLKLSVRGRLLHLAGDTHHALKHYQLRPEEITDVVFAEFDDATLRTLHDRLERAWGLKWKEARSRISATLRSREGRDT